MCPWIKGLVADWVLKIQNDEEQYDNAIRSFLTFSFVRRDVESRNLSIHPIVHQWIPSLYGSDIQQNFCEKVAELARRSFMLDYTLEAVQITKQLTPLLSQLRPRADRCVALVSKELAQSKWTATTLISFGAYYFSFSSQHDYSTARLLVKSGMRCFEVLEYQATDQTIVTSFSFAQW